MSGVASLSRHARVCHDSPFVTAQPRYAAHRSCKSVTSISSHACAREEAACKVLCTSRFSCTLHARRGRYLRNRFGLTHSYARDVPHSQIRTETCHAPPAVRSHAHLSPNVICARAHPAGVTVSHVRVCVCSFVSRVIPTKRLISGPRHDLRARTLSHLSGAGAYIQML